MKNKKSYVYIGLPVLGMIFYLAYIRRSAIDMVYSDYIRLINTFFICTRRPLIWSIPIISASPSPICRTCGTRISFLWRICSQEFR